MGWLEWSEISFMARPMGPFLIGLWQSPSPLQWICSAVFSPESQGLSFLAVATLQKTAKQTIQQGAKAPLRPPFSKPETATWGGPIMKKEISIMTTYPSNQPVLKWTPKNGPWA